MPSSLKQRSLLLRALIWLVLVTAGITLGAFVFEALELASTQPDMLMSERVLRIITLLAVNLVLTMLIATACAFYFWLRISQSLPDLKGWHLQSPASEFNAKDASSEYTLDDYLTQERRVFEELETLTTNHWGTDHAGDYNRFKRDSICDPASVLDHNWNRSRILECQNPIGGVLLIHGLSDSPYSLRKLGERLHSEGYTVIWLRVPGHGTTPHALTEISWDDWTAAIRIAVKGLRSRVPASLPIFLAGYSNGGALSVHYTLSAMEDESLPPVAGVALLSPMLGINPMAKMTHLSHFVGMISRNEKTKWSHIYAEIDPFKYSSWPMNANAQAWSMTQAVEKKLIDLQQAGRIHEMPPMLAMQSVVDSTVSVPRLITALFGRLQSEKSELFLFDINRLDKLSNLVNFSFEKGIMPTLEQSDLPCRLSILHNRHDAAEKMSITTRLHGQIDEKHVPNIWPPGFVSLSHVAIPIAPDDPVYGDRSDCERLSLGCISVRAEPSALMIPSTLFTRCRHNPFYGLMEDHILNWLGSLQERHRPPPEVSHRERDSLSRRPPS